MNSFIKFCDGEFNAMFGKVGTNCDNQPYSKQLGKDLLQAYKYLAPKLPISDWIIGATHYEYYNNVRDLGFPTHTLPNRTYLHQTNNLVEVQSKYKQLAATGPILWVGPKRLRGISCLIPYKKYVDVPLLDAYKSFPSILAEVVNNLQPVVVFTCGYISCLLAYHIHRIAPDTTLIDVGSGVDNLLIGKTRRNQVDRVSAQKLYPCSFPPVPDFSDEIPGWYNFRDLYSEMVNKSPNGHFVEVGTWMGKSAASLCALGPNIKLDCIDHFQGSPKERKKTHKDRNVYGKCRNFLRPFWCTTRNKKCHTRRDNQLRILKTTSREGARRYANKSLDFVFIDADHTYAAVKDDIRCWLPKIKPGGVLAGHDYQSKSFPGVTKAVNQLLPSARKISSNCWIYHG